jgi:hypothetical protein
MQSDVPYRGHKQPRGPFGQLLLIIKMLLLIQIGLFILALEEDKLTLKHKEELRNVFHVWEVHW